MIRTVRLRRSPIRKSRAKARPGRLKGKDMQMLRVDCYARDRGRCQECGIMTIFDAPAIWENSYHLAHYKAKRIGGDSLQNVRVLCGKCHRAEHNPKACPPKPRASSDANVLLTKGGDAMSETNMPIRMHIALKMARAWSLGDDFDGQVTVILRQWIDGGMKGPIPWPTGNPFFDDWAERNGLSDCGGYVGFRCSVQLTAGSRPRKPGAVNDSRVSDSKGAY